VRVSRRPIARNRRPLARDRSQRVHYTLQDTHAHLIVEASNARALGRGMMAVGARIARALNRTFGHRGPVLAERFHARVLRTPREVRNALAYVLLNTRRHARKLWRGIRIDPASSGRWFDGWRQAQHVDGPNVDTMPVIRPLTWLLAIGWRRHGLIDPEEVHGARAHASSTPTRMPGAPSEPARDTTTHSAARPRR